MRILVTGFDPFGGERINPSIEAVKKLPDLIGSAELIKLEVPTVWKKSLAVIEEAIVKYGPDAILSVGQAGGRAEITVERVGINLDDFSIRDNDGNQITDRPIAEDGPAAYFMTLPVKAIVKRMREKGIPASVSNTAGTFVCNHVAYGVSHLIATRYPGKISGFIHIPYLPEQTVGKGNIPSMGLDMIVEGLKAAIEVIAHGYSAAADEGR